MQEFYAFLKETQEINTKKECIEPTKENAKFIGVWIAREFYARFGYYYEKTNKYNKNKQTYYNNYLINYSQIYNANDYLFYILIKKKIIKIKTINKLLINLPFDKYNQKDIEEHFSEYMRKMNNIPNKKLKTQKVNKKLNEYIFKCKK